MQLPDTTALDSLHKEWPVIKAAPYSFVSSVVILCLIIGTIIWLLFRGRLERHKEQIGHLERDVARLSKGGAHKTDTAAKEQTTGHPKLIIHSAVYGTGPIDDVPITERLRTSVRDALVVPVDNNLVPRDPAIGKVKRLAVEYSYGNPSIQQASRLEGERLVLPEDSEIQRLRGEIEQLKRKEHPAKLRDRIFDVCLRLKAFLDKHGKRPNPYLIPHKDKDEYVRLYQETVQTWDDKFQADYWLNWKDKILALRHELVLMSLTDDILDKNLMESDTPNLSDKTVESINEKLRILAAQLD